MGAVLFMDTFYGTGEVRVSQNVLPDVIHFELEMFKGLFQ